MAQQKRKPRKQEKPRRVRGAYSNALVSSIQKRIEKDYELPVNSIKLVNPSGRKARANARISTFLRNWE